MRFEPVASRYQCDALTNWAMKALMLGTHKSLKTSFNLILFSLITSSQVMNSQTWKINCYNVKVDLGSCLQVIIVPSAADCQKVFVYNHINKKDQRLLKEQILEWTSIISPSVPPFSCTWKTRLKFWKSWVLSRWRKTHIQAPHIQNLGAFVLKHSLLRDQQFLSLVQTFWPWGQQLFALLKLSDPGANLFVQILLKFPTWGGCGGLKFPHHPVQPPPPPLKHDIDGCIKYTLGPWGAYSIRKRVWWVCGWRVEVLGPHSHPFFHKNPASSTFSQSFIFLLTK